MTATILEQAGDTLGGYLPRFAGAILLLLIGLLAVARHHGAWCGAGCRRRASTRSANGGAPTTCSRASVCPAPSAPLLAGALRIGLLFVVVFAALSVLGFAFLSDSLNAGILFLPRLFVALVLLLVGLVLSELVRGWVGRLAGQMDLPGPVDVIAQMAVLAVFAVTALAADRRPDAGPAPRHGDRAVSRSTHPRPRVRPGRPRRRAGGERPPLRRRVVRHRSGSLAQRRPGANRGLRGDRDAARDGRRRAPARAELPAGRLRRHAPFPAAGLSSADRARAAPPAISRTEGEEREVPAERCAEVVAHVVDAEQLVIDQALHDVEHAPAGEQHPDVRAPRRRQLSPLPGPHGEHRCDRDEDPGRRWKNPSARVLASSPATVVLGYSPVPVSRWCHWRTWWSTMPSMNPPSPRPRMKAGARGGRDGTGRALPCAMAGQSAP